MGDGSLVIRAKKRVPGLPYRGFEWCYLNDGRVMDAAFIAGRRGEAQALVETTQYEDLPERGWLEEFPRVVVNGANEGRWEGARL